MIVISGSPIRDLERHIERYGHGAKVAAQIAINDTARWTRERLKKAMQAEVNLSESAFNRGQLKVAKFARPDDLEAIVRGSHEAYSLSRFKVGNVGFGPSAAGQVQVRVGTKGKTVNLKRAFYVRAPNGAIGIGVRSNKQLDHSRAARRIPGTNVFILFGPSPHQLMRRMAPLSAPVVAFRMRAEYTRQLYRLTQNG